MLYRKIIHPTLPDVYIEEYIYDKGEGKIVPNDVVIVEEFNPKKEVEDLKKQIEMLKLELGKRPIL